MKIRLERLVNLEKVTKKPQVRTPTCPQCGKVPQRKYRPFCSQRCAQLDLGRWLNEEFRVPVVESDDIDEFEEKD